MYRYKNVSIIQSRISDILLMFLPPQLIQEHSVWLPASVFLNFILLE